MAHNVKTAYMIAEKPWVVVPRPSPDGDALHAFLAGLNGAGASDLGKTEETLALWAVQVQDTAEAGTVYVVSPEAYKRVKAFRY